MRKVVPKLATCVFNWKLPPASKNFGRMKIWRMTGRVRMNIWVHFKIQLELDRNISESSLQVNTNIWRILMSWIEITLSLFISVTDKDVFKNPASKLESMLIVSRWVINYCSHFNQEPHRTPKTLFFNAFVHFQLTLKHIFHICHDICISPIEKSNQQCTVKLKDTLVFLLLSPAHPPPSHLSHQLTQCPVSRL